MLRTGQSHVTTVERERLGDLRAHEVGDPEAGHAPDDLAHDEAERHRVVSVLRPGLECGSHPLEAGDHRVPVEDLLRTLEERRHVVHAGFVAEHLADRDRVLPVLRELGPVVGDTVVVVDEASVHADVERGRGHSLGRGVRHGKAVRLPGVPGEVGDAAPRVDHGTAPVVHAYGPATPRLRHLGVEDRDHLVERRLPRPLRHGADPSCAHGCAVWHVLHA